MFLASELFLLLRPIGLALRTADCFGTPIRGPLTSGRSPHAPFDSDFPQNLDHGESSHGGLRTLIAGLARSIHRLLHSVNGQHSETYGNARLQGDLLKCLTDGTADVLEMRSFTADDTAKGDNRVVLFRYSSTLDSYGDFEGAR